ncbi:MAG: SRPBCC family protein [Chloroflexi bacterium]|nr:SRPBCC family protein [Chloroflexota bacterium]
MANIDVTVQAETSAPPEAVFAVLSDLAQMPSWANGVQSAQWEDGSDLRPGGRFNLKYRYSRRVSDITMEVTAVEPGVRLEYHTVEGPYPIEAKFTLAGAADGTAVTYGQKALPDSKLASIAFLLTGWIAKRMLRKQLRKDIEKLSALAKSANTAAS